MSGEHLLLIIVCLSWCALHSLLISGAVSTGIKRLLGRFTSCYRLIYNGVALLTLLPLAAYIHARPGEVVFDWSGADLLRLSLLAAALLVFFRCTSFFLVGTAPLLSGGVYCRNGFLDLPGCRCVPGGAEAGN